MLSAASMVAPRPARSPGYRSAPRDFQQAGLLEMADDEGRHSPSAPASMRVADHLRARSGIRSAGENDDQGDRGPGPRSCTPGLGAPASSNACSRSSIGRLARSDGRSSDTRCRRRDARRSIGRGCVCSSWVTPTRLRVAGTRYAWPSRIMFGRSSEPREGVEVGASRDAPANGSAAVSASGCRTALPCFVA